MAIEFILSGYFRSGTTLLFESVKAGSPGMSIFYEPCHHELIWYLKQNEANKKKDPLHDIELWNEYFRQDKSFLDHLALLHPNIGRPYSFEWHRVSSYIDIFNFIDGPVVLQVNRWLHFLDLIGYEFRCKLVHIIRNPYDVFLSMLAATHKMNLGWTKFSSGLHTSVHTKTHLLDLFYQNQMYDFFLDTFEIPLNNKPNLLSKRACRWVSTWERFVVVWIMLNSLAISALGRQGGLLLTYEALCDYPDEVSKKLSNYGLIIDKSVVRKNKRHVFIEPNEYEKLMEIATKYHISSRLDFILKELIKYNFYKT